MECDLTIAHSVFFLVKSTPVNVSGIILNLENQLLLIPRPKKQEVAGMARLASALVQTPLPRRKSLLVNITYISYVQNKTV